MIDVGCVIGRFQVDNLHDGHRYLINEAFRHHNKVIVFVGCAPILGTKYEPLDFPTRERMLKSEYPDAIVLPQYDHLSDEIWSINLDAQIKGIIPNAKGVRLYGGRDSFQKHYFGEFDVVEVDSGIEYKSGTKQREAIGKVVRSSSDFRAGIIYSTQNAWPYTKICTDIAVVKRSKCDDELSILIGRKRSENKWRLPGGGVDRGESLEDAALRELREETRLIGSKQSLKYMGSYTVSDWRYKNAGEIGLLTGLFILEDFSGEINPEDDLIEIKWCSIKDAEKIVIRGHKKLIAVVRKEINKDTKV